MTDRTSSASEKPMVRLKMADIARMAGVSVSSVSRALAGSPLIPQTQRDKINAIARENGYVVNLAARNLRLQTTQTIGLVLPLGHEDGQAISDPFLLELIGCLADEVVRRGYDLLLSKVTATHEGWLRELTGSHRFDGLLVLGQSDQHKVINNLAHHYPAMVVWGEKLPDQAYCSVGVDNCLGGYLATRHMVASGCRDILFLGPKGIPEAEARFSGYARGLASAPFRMGEAIECETHFFYESGYEVVRDLIHQKHVFDGLFCASDIIAQGAMAALAEAGLRVPEDVAVCGFDDIAVAKNLSPALTTVCQDRKLGAKHMVDLLFRRLGGEASEPMVMAPNLVVRASTRPV